MGLFVIEAITLLGLIGGLIYFGALTYKAWTKPMESWGDFRSEMARRRAWVRKWGFGWFPIDILGLENHEDRYLLFGRGVLVAIDVWLMVFLIGSVCWFLVR